jgi:hypothetical protein
MKLGCSLWKSFSSFFHVVGVDGTSPRRDIEPSTRNVHDWRSPFSPCWIDWMPYLRINTCNCPSYTKLPIPVVMASPRREKDVTKIDARQSCAQHDSIFSFTLQRPWVFL